MDTENNHENKPKDQPKTIDGQDEKMPVIKIKRQASQDQLDHPLHGVKLVEILESLVEHYGWKFKWAREHVEDLYMDMLDAGIDPKGQKNKKADSKT
jgi:uncharacterized protein (DUF2132 family)